MIETISKNLFLNAVLCATLGWRLRADESLDEAAFASPTLAEQFRMEQGAEIGRRARKLFPDGVLISTGNLSKATAETAKLIRAGGPSVLFEATFVVDQYAAKADVLRRDGDAWHLIEVKSNVNLNAGAVAEHQVRGGVSESLPDRRRGPNWDQCLPGVLQPAEASPGFGLGPQQRCTNMARKKGEQQLKKLGLPSGLVKPSAGVGDSHLALVLS